MTAYVRHRRSVNVAGPNGDPDVSTRAKERLHLLEQMRPQALVVEVENERVDDGPSDDPRDHRDLNPCPRRGLSLMHI